MYCSENKVKREGLKLLHGLTFDDVLILPELTDVRPDQVNLTSQVLPNVEAGLPIWAAPMTTVWSSELTVALAECGALAPIHREMNIEELKTAIDKLSATKVLDNDVFQNVKIEERPPIIVATSPFDDEKIRYLTRHRDVDYIIFDTVQPYSSAILKSVATYSKLSPGKIIVGNVATAEAAAAFSQYDIAGLKVGLGPGSICTTRSISGVGVPQLEAIQEVKKGMGTRKLAIIADGGIRDLGDVAKALAAGATSVMMGNIFAGTKECAGEIVEFEGVMYKKYDASYYASVEHTLTGILEIDEYFNRPDIRIEGASGLVQYKGSAKVVLYQIKRALGATLGFVGAHSIEEFQSKVRLIQVSTASHRESHFHSLNKITSFNSVITKLQ